MACLGLLWPGCVNGKCEDRQGMACSASEYDKYDCDECDTVWLCLTEGGADERHFWARANHPCSCIGEDGSYLYVDSADPNSSPECAFTEGR